MSQAAAATAMSSEGQESEGQHLADGCSCDLVLIWAWVALA